MTIYLVTSPGRFGGDGSKENPLHIESAAHFDATLQAIQTQGWTTIELGEGVFETRGVWAYPGYSTFSRPIRIRGAGIEETRIRLSGDAVTQTDGKDRPDLNVLRFGVRESNNSGPYTLEDLTIDGNEGAFRKDQYVTAGAFFTSNNVTCTRVKVRGLRGSHNPAHEAFGLLCNNRRLGPYTGPDGNCHFIDCVVESAGDEEEPYVSPFYIGVQDFGRPLAQSSIVGCRTIGTGSKPVRLGVSIGSAVVIDRFSADNVQHAIYWDTSPVRDAVVRNSRFTRLSYSGPWFVVNAPIDRVLIERCDFEFEPPQGNSAIIGMTIWDKFATGALASGIICYDCVFRLEGATPFTPTSIKCVKAGIQLANAKIPENSKPIVAQEGVLYSFVPAFETITPP